ncbi:MAG: 1-acyl-sn-glycerol-3-phosphate acyltransferase [Clostridia bacterium]|nr:1-acyl-sn-glycerol-3-phosphate acyltransferase [Clostridia bacterium]
MAISKEKQELINKIKSYEKQGLFDVDVNDDPPAPALLPENADYICKKFKNKINRFIANAVADRYYLNLIKKGRLIIDGIEGEEYIKEGLKNGAIITCNHFSPFDNYIIFHCIRKYLPKKYLYKVIREGNYTNFPGLYGFFFKHCNTLPLSSNRRTMIMFTAAVKELLSRGESILIYPEQAMWYNYKKPRPFKNGAFKIAFKNKVPVLPLFITMQDSEKLDSDGMPIQRHVLHVSPPIYPNESLSAKEGAEAMLQEAYLDCKKIYEKVYGKKLSYEDE